MLPTGCFSEARICIAIRRSGDTSRRLAQQFPFSLVNEQQDFDGRHNEGGRAFATHARRARREGLTIPFRGKKYRGRAGMTIFNITNHWNPRDVQNNVDSRQFGVLQQPGTQRAP